MSVTERDDPYRSFAASLERGEVAAEESDTAPNGSPRQWYAIFGWDAVSETLTDPALSSGIYDDHMGLGRRGGAGLIGLDGAEHRAHREILRPLFSRHALDEGLGEQLAGTVDHLIDGLAGQDRCDLVVDLCERVPLEFMVRLLGVPAGAARLLAAQAEVLVGDQRRARDAARALDSALLSTIGAARRQDPRPDALSLLATARVDGLPLTDEEVLHHLRLLAIAGTDTLAHATANMLFGLLIHPEQLAAVAADPRLVPVAVDESLRWECPALTVPRIATSDTRIRGTQVSAPSGVRCHLGSANADPRRWESPREFDIQRERKPHAAFGLGPHMCLGMTLARHLMTLVAERLVSRHPTMRLDRSATPPSIHGTAVRRPDHLRVRLD